MTKILAIDSCLGNGSVALADADGVKFFSALPDPGSQAEKLVLLIEDVMQDAALEYSDLSHIAVTVGPGSFTAVRIGLSTARGIGFAAGLPVIGFSTLACVANAAGGANKIAMIEAGRGECYWQAFGDNGIPLNEIAAASYEAIAEFAAAEGLAMPAENIVMADAKNLATLALQAISGSGIALPPQPIYIRPPDAKMPAKTGLN